MPIHRSSPLVIAHRGASAYEPENTLRSVLHALDLGTHGVEVDVRRTRDGELVIMHDETVSRTTNGTGRVSDLSLAEIRRLDAGFGETVPTLRDVVLAVRKRAFLVVEFKEQGVWRDALRLVAEDGELERSVFVSFLAGEIQDIGRSDGKVRTGILFHGASEGAVDRTVEARARIAGFRQDGITEHLVDLAHRAGLEALTWTVDDSGRARQVAALGVDYIASNAPDRVLSALARP